MRRLLTVDTLLLAGVVARVLTPLPLSAQAPADAKPPTFEVASVKPTKIAGASLIMLYPGGRFSATNFALRGLITRAWGLQSDQVDGGPGWSRSDGFDIEATSS